LVVLAVVDNAFVSQGKLLVSLLRSGNNALYDFNKEIPAVKYNTLVNDEPSVEVSEYCADILHQRSAPSVVTL